MSFKFLFAFALTIFAFFSNSSICEEYKTLRTARHDNYELRFHGTNPQAAPWTIAFGSKANPALIHWNNSRVWLSTSQNEARIAEQKAVLPESFDVTIRHRNGMIEFTANGQRLIRTMLPNIGKGQIAISKGADITLTSYQRLEPFTFGDDFMRTEEEAKQWGLWTPLSGKWLIHSVMERIHANPDARIREGREPVPDRSPNPFCIAGSAEEGEALIIAGQDFWCDYEAAVSVRPAKGEAFALAFAVIDKDNFWRLEWMLPSLGKKASNMYLIHRKNGKDTTMAQTVLRGRAENWQRLAVKIFGSDITALLDSVPVLTAQSSKCIGGKIGLFCKGPVETRFDDVNIRSIDEIPFSQIPIEKNNALIGSWNTGEDPIPESWAENNRQPLLAFGFESWSKVNMQTTVNGSGFFALCFAVKDKDNFLQAEWSAADGGTAAFTKWQNGKQVTIAKLKYKRNKSCHAGLFFEEDGCVYFRIDGQLILRIRPDAELTGRVGLSASKDTSFSHTSLFGNLSRDWERPVDIARFANDPFMQGWASTRYAWLRQTQNKDLFPQRHLFTGDIYGALELDAPLMPGLNFLFGSDDLEHAYCVSTELDKNTGSGAVKLLKDGKLLSSANFTGKKAANIPGTQIVDEKIGARPRTPDTPSWGNLSIRKDGHAIWIILDGTEILNAREENPLTGRALAVDIPCPIDFINIAVRREKLLDYLFEQAETDWGGIGRWEVTNRFACDPRWSHMNGESKGTASIWSKFQLQGDFTIECFAGMRMRQGELLEGAKISYPRVGDINVAMDADGHELFSGHNLIVAAWDKDWSEKWTRFLSGSKTIAKSDLELIPRGRHFTPSARPIGVDWDPGGRPVHGAWYALKIRKTGNSYSVWFDNTKVFDCKDSAPPGNGGHLALWTQHNSIVLARVKVSYSKLLRNAPEGTIAEKGTEGVSTNQPNVLQLLGAQSYNADFENGLSGIAPWNQEQSAELGIVPRKTGGNALRAENVNSGGDFGIRLPVTGLDLMRVDSISFDALIPDGVFINLYFTVKEDPHATYFVSITGPAEDQPNRFSIGSFGNIKTGKWRKLSIKLAQTLMQSFPWHGSWTCDSMMLGMLHEGYLNSGMDGNKEGAVYYLDNLHVVPSVSLVTTAQWKDEENIPNAAVWLADDLNALCPKGTPFNRNKDTELTASKPGLHFVIAEDETGKRLAALPVQMCKPENTTRTTPAHNKDWGFNPVIIQFGKDTCDLPVLNSCKLQVNSNDIPVNRFTSIFDGEKRTLAIPVRLQEFSKADLSAPVNFTFKWKNISSDRQNELQWSAKPNPKLDKTPPLPPLLDPSITKFAGRLDNDINFLKERKNATGKPNIELLPNGRFAASSTAYVAGADITIPLANVHFDAAAYPILFFEYNIPKNVHVDLMTRLPGKPFTIGITDLEEKNETFLGPLPGIAADGKWHSAKVNLCDFILRRNMDWERKNLTVHELSIGNFNYKGTQPGASYKISNVSLAPLMSSLDAPIRLSWATSDPGGIAGYAVVIDNKQDTVPKDSITHTANNADITLEPGLNFIHVRACDNNGNWSHTTHQPILATNNRPAVASLLPADKTMAAPQKIQVTFTQESGLIDFSEAKLELNGKEIRLSRQFCQWDPNTRSFSADLLQNQLFFRKLEDKTPFTAKLSGIKNFAKLNMPDMEWSWNLDFAQDKNPPPPPNVSAYDGLFKQFQSFSSTHYWRGNRANAQVVTDQEINSKCLDISFGPDNRQRCIASSWHEQASIDRFPTLRFRYKINPGSDIDLLFFCTKEWKSVQFSGDTGAEHAAQLNGVIADGKWHWISFDLKPLLAKVFPDGKPVLFSAFGFGSIPAPKRKSSIRIDDVAFIGQSGPLPLFYMRQSDETGIQKTFAKISRNPEDISFADDSSLAMGPSKNLKALDKTGLWFLHTKCLDGAGNFSEVTHLPFLCTETAEKLQDDGLEAEETTTWQLASPSKAHPQAFLHQASTDGGNKILAIQFYGGKNTETAIMRKFEEDSIPNGFKLDLLVQGSKEFSVKAVAYTAKGKNLRSIIKANKMLASSKEIKIKESNTWERNIELKFNSPLPAAPLWIGILVTAPQNNTDSVIFDNLSILK